MAGKLSFPVVIGSNKEIGDYIHVQEFYEAQLRLLLTEVGFVKLEIRHIYLGLHFLGLKFRDYPLSNFGKTMSHFLMVKAFKSKD